MTEVLGVDAVRVMVTDYIEESLSLEVDGLSGEPVEFDAFQLKGADPEELLSHVSEADILVVNMAVITAEVIEGLTRCKLIIRHGVGYDNIDVRAATEAGIPVMNVPDYCIREVAEQTVALLLALCRRIPEQNAAVSASLESGRWSYDGIPVIGRFQGSTVGIIGFGRIGATVRSMLSGMDVRILACDPYMDDEEKAAYGIEHTPLEELLKASDYVVISTVLNERTRHMIGRDALALMKPSAFLINTARGGIVDQDALAEALRNRSIAGAAVDVYEYSEPPGKNNPLLWAPNIILTPHMAWYSRQAALEIRYRIVDAVKAFVRGRIPGNIVNPEVWPSYEKESIHLPDSRCRVAAGGGNTPVAVRTAVHSGSAAGRKSGKKANTAAGPRMEAGARGNQYLLF